MIRRKQKQQKKAKAAKELAKQLAILQKTTTTTPMPVEVGVTMLPSSALIENAPATSSPTAPVDRNTDLPQSPRHSSLEHLTPTPTSSFLISTPFNTAGDTPFVTNGYVDMVVDENNPRELPDAEAQQALSLLTQRTEKRTDRGPDILRSLFENSAAYSTNGLCKVTHARVKCADYTNELYFTDLLQFTKIVLEGENREDNIDSLVTSLLDSDEVMSSLTFACHKAYECNEQGNMSDSSNTAGDGYCGFRNVIQATQRDKEVVKDGCTADWFKHADNKITKKMIIECIQGLQKVVKCNNSARQSYLHALLDAAKWHAVTKPHAGLCSEFWLNGEIYEYLPTRIGSITFLNEATPFEKTVDHKTVYFKFGQLNVLSRCTLNKSFMFSQLYLTAKEIDCVFRDEIMVGFESSHHFPLCSGSGTGSNESFATAIKAWTKQMVTAIKSLPEEEKRKLKVFGNRCTARPRLIVDGVVTPNTFDYVEKPQDLNTQPCLEMTVRHIHFLLMLLMVINCFSGQNSKTLD